jgi:hypothetical protein
VKTVQRLDRRAPGEPVGHALPSGLAHLRPQDGCVAQPQHRRHEFIDVAPADEQSCPQVIDGFRNAAAVAADDRKACRCRLEKYHPESLDVTVVVDPVGMDEHVSRRVVVGQLFVGHLAGEPHGVAEALFPDEPFEPRAFVAVADDEVADVGTHRSKARHAPDHEVVPLARLQAADRQEHELVVQSEARSRRRSFAAEEAGRIDARVDD